MKLSTHFPMELIGKPALHGKDYPSSASIFSLQALLLHLLKDTLGA